MVGRALWDVFSDNHDVIAPDGREVHLGSFRAAGDFIADLLNDEVGSRQYGYMDFYMGTIWINDRADLTPVYAMIFPRLPPPRYHFVKLAQLYWDPRDRVDRRAQAAQLRIARCAGCRKCACPLGIPICRTAVAPLAGGLAERSAGG